MLTYVIMANDAGSSHNSARMLTCLTQSFGSILLLSVVLLLLLCGVTPAAAVSINRNDSYEGHCVVVLEHTEILKEIGSVWVASENPCAIHSCEADDAGRAHETISKKDCGQFYCEVDSELRSQEGTCCGTCVRTKCLFNETVYEVGQTWHNNYDCTLLECTQLPGGQPIINAYQKSCPPMPADCAKEHVIEVDCCAYCSSASPRATIANEAEEIWTEEYYRNHPCVRECRLDTPPMTCRYTFVVEWYETLSKACFDCPKNVTDCQRPHCIVGDGIRRSITVVNRMMPGPSIEVCQNDMLVVDVKNHLLGESTTIHWHGMHQRDTPYMDGVPHISQCPISPHSTFRYTFKAENSGTHFWHSHTGMQRGDGVYGAFIVRRPKAVEPHGHLYDFDLSEHTMLVQDWVHVPGVVMFSSHHHSQGDNKPMNLLMNGKGRYYRAIWEKIKEADKMQARSFNIAATTNTATEKGTEIITELPANTDLPEVTQVANTETQTAKDFNILDQDVDLLYVPDEPEEENLRLKETNQISRLTRTLALRSNESVPVSTRKIEFDATNATVDAAKTAKSTDSTGAASVLPAHTKHNTRAKRDIPVIPEVPMELVPLHVFNVTRGFRYRFRIINAEFLNCPIKLSIDNHSLTALNSDGYDFEAVEVGSIVTYAGERFDFVVNANQTPGNYWIRLKGLMDCSEKFTSAFQVAVLHYETSPTADPSGEPSYDHQSEGIELNVMNRGPGHVDSLTIAELTALQHYDTVPGIDRDALKQVADYKFFVYYDFYAKDNPVFHPADYYGFNESLGQTNRLFTPQLNHISLKFPSVALLPSRDDLDDSMFCNDTSLAAQGIDCRKEFCKCHHVLQVPLNSVVELIIVDEGFTFDANHPFHLHGNAFRVVGLERLGANVTIEMIKQLDRYNMLKRNLVRPPIKDTVTVPDGGYTILRFEAYNPGFWLFHCHIEFHAEIGMALVLKVGDNDEMLPVPKNFPTCSDYMPDMSNASGDSGTGAAVNEGIELTTASPDRNTGRSLQNVKTLNLLTLLAIILSIIKFS